MEPFDVAVVGGSFAGLTAALMLARGRRRVAVFDTGLPRNRFSPASHGVFGLDGRAPAEIVAQGRRDLAAYPTVSRVDAGVARAEGKADAFRLTDEAGRETLARRLVLAFGMRDLLPGLPGLAECWGVSAVHCPYCHGHELADLPTLVLMTRPVLPHQALMLGEWTGQVGVLTAGQDLAPEDRATLEAQGVAVEDRPPLALEHEGGHLRAVRLAGGEAVDCGALYLAPDTEPACDLAAQLGCAMAEGPCGPHVEVDEHGATSVPGVFAAGDLAHATPSAPLAVARGAVAGTACHRSLMPAYGL